MKPVSIDTKKFMSCKPTRSELSGFLLIDDEYKPICEIFAKDAFLIDAALKERGLKKIDHASLLDSETTWKGCQLIVDVPSGEIMGVAHCNDDLSSLFHDLNDFYLVPVSDPYKLHLAYCASLMH